MVLVLFAGCGDDAASSLSAEETAQVWVDAINSGNYDRACDLSAFEKKSDCLAVMKTKPFAEEVALDWFSSDGSAGDGEGTASLSFGGTSDGGRTMSAGLAEVDVERHGDQYKIHFEHSIIK